MADEKVQITMDCKTPANVADALASSGCVKRINASVIKLLILGFFAGAYIAFGASLSTLVGHDAAKFVGMGLAKFAMGGVFSFGLMLVVVAGAELFTGNNLMVISALGGKVSFKKVAYSWVVVYIANFIGAVFLAWLMFQTNLWKANAGEVGAFAVKIASAKVNLTFSEAFFRGIGCNWLVCLAVWMAIASRDVIGKIGAIFFPIMAFVALGFEHCVANMYFIPLGIFLKGTVSAVSTGLDLSNLTWSSFAITNLVPVTIGNIVGGAVFVASLYWVVYLKAEKA